MSFVNLHCHTGFSRNSTMCPEDLCEQAYEYNQNAVAITDNANLQGAVRFVSSALDYGIKPIIGAEVFVVDRIDSIGRELLASSYHLVLLAMNYTGYLNLIKIVNYGYKNCFYYKPYVEFGFVSSNSDGLIALSGCTRGLLSKYYLTNSLGLFDEAVDKFNSAFCERFYLEIQPPKSLLHSKYNDFLYDYGTSLNKNIVLTCNSKFREGTSLELATLMQRLRKELVVDDISSISCENIETFKSYDMVSAICGRYSVAIENSCCISDLVENYDIFQAKNRNCNYVQKNMFHNGDILDGEHVKSIGDFSGNLAANNDIDLALKKEIIAINNSGMALFFYVASEMSCFARLFDYEFNVKVVGVYNSLILAALGVGQSTSSCVDNCSLDLVFDDMNSIVVNLGAEHFKMVRSHLKLIFGAEFVASSTRNICRDDLRKRIEKYFNVCAKEICEVEDFTKVSHPGVEIERFVEQMNCFCLAFEKNDSCFYISSGVISDDFPIWIDRGADIVIAWESDEFDDGRLVKVCFVVNDA